MFPSRENCSSGVVHLILALGVLLLATAHVAAQERYSLVSISMSSDDDLDRIARLGIAVDEADVTRKGTIQLYVSGRERDLLDEHAVPYVTLIEDWNQYYQRRQASEPAPLPQAPSHTSVQGFHYGSMGGYLTYEEVLADLDSMRARYPSLITAREAIGYSHEGRALWAAKISARADLEEDEPRAFYNALTHAREGGGMMTLLYTMWYLLEHYGDDPEVTGILDSRELYFLPVVNPDGYVYNQTTWPSGGGMWRKNRLNNGDGSYGVDLNRNYGYGWGYDDLGSSPTPSSDLYRGPSAFSEPEIWAIRDYCTLKNFTVALNYHTYSNLLIYPWGFSDTDSPDSTKFRQLAEMLTAVNRYSYGTPGQTVGYITNGGADDWMYGDTLLKPKVFSMTPELGSPVDGFWPPQSRILPIALENLQANLTLARAAGPYIGVSTSELDTSGGNHVLRLRFEDRGVMRPPDELQLRLWSPELEFVDSVISSVAWNTPQPLTVAVIPGPNVWPGQPVTIIAAMTYEGGTTLDTLRERLGPATVLYADDAESTRANWVAQSNVPGTVWDTTSASSHSGTRSFSESPEGFYADNMTSTFTLGRTLPLTGSAAELRFWLRWSIETNYDYLTAEISTDGGSQWLALSGKYTAQGSGVGVQTRYAPGYDGVKHTWVEERMELPIQALLKDVTFRFRFTSDGYTTLEGSFVDDLRLLLYPMSPDDVPDLSQPIAYALEQSYPNPFNPSTEIGVRMAAAGRMKLSVYDLLGREVRTLVDGWMDAGRHTVRFDAEGLASGVYVYRLQAGSFVAARTMLLLR